MQRIINDILHHRDEYCSELFDIWSQLYDMVGDKSDPTLEKLKGHFAAAHDRKEIKEMLIYIKELIFMLKN